MGRTKLYGSNSQKQKAYRERVEKEEEANKPVLSVTSAVRNLVDYFKRIEKLDPIAEQISILEDMENPLIKNLAVACGRGFSKSTLASDMSLWFADNYARRIGMPVDVLLLSSQGVIYTHLDKFFRDDPALKSRLRNTGRSYEMPQKSLQLKDTWSTIFRVTPTEHNIRSLRCNVLIADEAASLSDNVLNTALSCLTGDLNKVVFISTCHKQHSLFNAIIKNRPKDWSVKQYSSVVCPWMEKTLDRLRAQIELGKFTSEDWAIEVEGRVPEIEELSTFDSKDVMGIVQKGIGLIGSHESKIVAGIDWGYGKNNRSLLVLIIAEKLRTKYNIIKVSTWNSDTINNAFLEIAKTLTEYNPIRINADSKPPEFKGKLEAQGLKLKINYIDLSKRFIEGQDKEKAKLPFQKEEGITYKQIAVNNLSSLIRTRSIAIDSNEEALIGELKSYRDGMQYGDDRVQALSLAVTDFPKKSDFAGCVTFSGIDFEKRPWLKFISQPYNRNLGDSKA